MGEPQPIKPIWDRIDEQRGQIRDLELNQANTKGQIDLLDSRLTTMQDSLTQHRSESRESLGKIDNALGKITTKIEAISLEAAANRGAGVSRREMFVWICGAASFLSAIAGAIAYFI